MFGCKFKKNVNCDKNINEANLLWGTKKIGVVDFSLFPSFDCTYCLDYITIIISLIRNYTKL